MRPRTLCGIVALAGLLAPGQALAQSKEFTQTVALDSGGDLTLRAVKGTVRLTAWDRDEVEVRATIEASDWFDPGYARRTVDATTIDVTGDRRMVSIRSNYEAVPPRWSWFSVGREIPRIHYVINAPAKLNLRLGIDRSDTELAGFDGRHSLTLDRSELLARDLSGTIQLTIDRGGRSELMAVRGAVELDADRTDVRIDAMRLESTSRVRVDRGDVEVRIPSSQQLRVRADLDRRGSFGSDFPLGRSGRDYSHVDGEINGGGPELRLRGDRTRIELRKRD
jgi:hypothetical protein